MKFCVGLIALLFALFSNVQGNEESKKKFKEHVETAGKECYEKHNPTDGDINALKTFDVPPTDNGKCFTGCVFEGLNMFKDGKMTIPEFMEKAKEWVPEKEKQDKLENVLNTCKSQVTSEDKCVFSKQIMECFHTHKDETDGAREYLAKVYSE
ncbi:general odorant-binding protein 56a-like [Periplaneta americana]|uniref:general odorant-binding protein 56a-like n=1 Tax=Periplaneta americana TaxID=6978 RepID=UPI0037E8F097